MNTKTLNTGEIVHDFRPNKLRWGWNWLGWKVADDKKTAEMIGIGKGLKAGDFIALNHGGQDFVHKIETIEYYTNPKDMFKATVSEIYEFDKGDLD